MERMNRSRPADDRAVHRSGLVRPAAQSLQQRQDIVLARPGAFFYRAADFLKQLIRRRTQLPDLLNQSSRNLRLAGIENQFGDDRGDWYSWDRMIIRT